MTFDLEEPVRDEDIPKTPGAIAWLAAKVLAVVAAGVLLEWSNRRVSAAMDRFHADLIRRVQVDPAKVIHVKVRTR
jgi:hypothetical protein